MQFAAAPALLDPDMFHEMALAREILATGRVPLADSFAYTPTVMPVIHHEWGTGVVLYVVAMHGGMVGMYLLLVALAAGIGVSGTLIYLYRAWRLGQWPFARAS